MRVTRQVVNSTDLPPVRVFDVHSERIRALEKKVADLEERLAKLEAYF